MNRARPGLGIVVPSIRLPDDYARLEEFKDLAARGAAGFIVYGGDDELLPPFLAALRRAAGRPLLIMSDVERGVGQQVAGCVELPPLMAVGATLSEERAYQHGKITALEARALGINMLLGPVADVYCLPSNPIVGNRSFGANPDTVARMTAAWIAGAQEQGVLACAKHFPGHGDTATDSHDDLPVVRASRDLLESRDLVPFRAAIDAGVGAVMTAHVAYPELDSVPGRPATLSPDLLGERLRDTMGFGGLVISDALTMTGVLTDPEGGSLTEAEAAVACVNAGCDILLGPTSPDDVAKALEEANLDGRLDLLAVEGRLRLTLADLVADFPEPGSLRAEHLYAAYGMARDSLTVRRNADRLLPLETAPRRRIMAILVDDDDEEERETPFLDREDDFAAGFVRRTAWSGGAEDQTLLSLAAEADLVFLAVACATRAYKGRAGISPDLAEMVSRLLEAAGSRTVCVVLGTPAALEGVEPRPRTLVAAWGAAPVCVTAAADVLLSGGPLRGLDPAP